ncbi:hypothetical protein IQB33_21665, partial [Leptospira interrogans serovar Pomona]|nr:hypothetical protein [Leptospira interrogans serovar Pomona]
EKRTECSHPESTCLDQYLNKSQTIDYGVSGRSGAKEVLPLINGQSFILYFYIGNPNKGGSENITNPEYSEDEMRIKDLTAEVDDLHVKLSWKAPEKADANTVYTIYQALKPLSVGSSTFLVGNVRKLVEVNHPVTEAQFKLI